MNNIFQFFQFLIFFIFSFFLHFCHFPSPPPSPVLSQNIAFLTKILILRQEEERRKKKAPTETGLLPQSHAQDLLLFACVETPHSDYCNLDMMKSGGLVPRHVTVICATFKTSCRTGKHPAHGVLERTNPWADNSFRVDLSSWQEEIRYSEYPP